MVEGVGALLVLPCGGPKVKPGLSGLGAGTDIRKGAGGAGAVASGAGTGGSSLRGGVPMGSNKQPLVQGVMPEAL